MAPRRRYNTRAAAAAAVSSTATKSDSSGPYTPAPSSQYIRANNSEISEAERRRELYRRFSIMGADAERPWVKEYERYRKESVPHYPLVGSYRKIEDKKMQLDGSEEMSEEATDGDSDEDSKDDEDMVDDESKRTPEAEDNNEAMKDFEHESRPRREYDSDEMRDAGSESEHESDETEDAESESPQPKNIHEPWPYSFRKDDKVWIWAMPHRPGQLDRLWRPGVIWSGKSMTGQTRRGEGQLYWAWWYPHDSGPKMRTQFAPLNGEIKPDTLHIRRLLRAAGVDTSQCEPVRKRR